MIRITGGINRSRLLLTPENGLTRPTMDKVRAGVFSALGDKIKNSSVLDLFAGSGSYGFESLSRGAESVVFVDKSFESIKIIKQNNQNLKSNNTEIICADVISFLNENTRKFDIIFADPPYKLDVYEDIVNIVNEKQLLAENGVLILESENELNIDKSSFKEVRFYKYGLAKIYLLRK